MPPAIWAIMADESNSVHFEVIASDSSGVRKVVVTYEEGDGEWKTVGLSRGNMGNHWTGDLDASASDLRYFVQAVDWAGNVALAANKGLFFGPPPGEVFLPLILLDW